MNTILLLLRLNSADPVKKYLSDSKKFTKGFVIDFAWCESDMKKEENPLGEIKSLQHKGPTMPAEPR